MFLAFPSSEVFYVVAIILAWLYIALGIIGNYQSSDQISSAYNNSQVQEHQIGFDERISSERNFYWVNGIQSPPVKTQKEHITFFFCFVQKATYRNRNEFPYSSYLDSSVPDRAPPFV